MTVASSHDCDATSLSGWNNISFTYRHTFLPDPRKLGKERERDGAGKIWEGKGEHLLLSHKS